MEPDFRVGTYCDSQIKTRVPKKRWRVGGYVAITAAPVAEYEVNYFKIMLLRVQSRWFCSAALNIFLFFGYFICKNFGLFCLSLSGLSSYVVESLKEKNSRISHREPKSTPEITVIISHSTSFS